MEELETLKKQAYDAAKEILEIGKCKAGDLFVVGCSTSEVLGDKIGTASSPETAQAVFAGIYQAVQEKQVYLATGALLVGAAALGIDSCTMEGFDQAALDAELDLHSKGLISSIVVSLGYRAAEDINAKLPKSRLPMADVITKI